MATVSEKEYLEQLHQIQSQNPPSIALLSNAEVIYDVDLSTRKIDSPKFLSVARDHKSETIYFRVDRFFDYMDLTNTICVVQYITSDGKPHVYAVPFYDVMTEAHNNKILIPWCIDGAATFSSGKIQYALRFYIVESRENGYHLTYNLNTLPATSQVLNGMDVQEKTEDFDITAEGYDTLLALINEVKQDAGVFWTFVETQEDLDNLSIH